MNYFQPYPLGTDDSVASAWESQVKESAQTPWLEKKLVERANELVPVFVAAYRELRALPRSARRTVQRQLSRSAELRGILRQNTHQPFAAELQRKLAYSLAGAALLLALGQGVAGAATIKVTTSNPNINDGDGKCSLIEAIVNANDDAKTFRDCLAGSGADTIVLPKKTIPLTYAYDNAYGPTGLPLITSQITIQGNGAKIIRQQPTHDNSAVPEFRLIAISSSGDLTLKQINLSGGYYQGHGGALFNKGNLAIIGSTISGNAAVSSYGGGVASYGGNLTITNSTISGNTARSAVGVYNIDGELTIINSTISGNTGVGRYSYGGGVGSFAAKFTIITNSTISGNTAGYGGGVYYSRGELTITNSTISGNTARSDGGGICGAYYYNGPGTLTIINSTISGNTAGLGGGVHNRWSELTITNSTISGNTASEGGGVFNSDYGYLTLNRSLISGNKASLGFGPEVFNSNPVSADDFNLFGNNGNAGVWGLIPGPSDIVPRGELSKILGPLRNNGGPTQTQALVRGSPAIDAISFTDPGCGGTDQRGVKRPRGHGCDIGAFEK